MLHVMTLRDLCVLERYALRCCGSSVAERPYTAALNSLIKDRRLLTREKFGYDSFGDKISSVTLRLALIRLRKGEKIKCCSCHVDIHMEPHVTIYGYLI
jgi:hypothetical protein